MFRHAMLLGSSFEGVRNLLLPRHAGAEKKALRKEPGTAGSENLSVLWGLALAGEMRYARCKRVAGFPESFP